MGKREWASLCSNYSMLVMVFWGVLWGVPAIMPMLHSLRHIKSFSSLLLWFLFSG